MLPIDENDDIIKKQKISEFIINLSNKQNEDNIVEKEKIGKFLKDFLQEEKDKKEKNKKDISVFIQDTHRRQKDEDLIKKNKISKFLQESLDQIEKDKQEKEENSKKQAEKINNFLSVLDKKQKENQNLEKEKVSKFLKDFLQEEKDKKEKTSLYISNFIEKEQKNKTEEKIKHEEFIASLSKEQREKELAEREKINNFINDLYKKQKENETKEKKKLEKFLKNFLNKEKENKTKELSNINSFLKTLSDRNFLSEEKKKEENKKLTEKIINFLKNIPKSRNIVVDNNNSLKGTNIGAPIVPGSESDTYPTHNERYGLGGYRSVANASERDAIPMPRRKAGMLVRVLDTSSDWILANDLITWIPKKVKTVDVDNLDDYLRAKADVDNPSFTGNMSVLGNINTIYANVNGALNTGSILAPGSFSTSKVSIRSKIIDFKIQQETELFEVPPGYMFLVDSMEIITTSIVSPRIAPTVRFGYNGANSSLYGPKKIESNSKGYRHIIENPQSGITEGNALTFGVTITSSATHHEGVGVINGYLLKISENEYTDVPPLSPGEQLNLCEQNLGTVLSCNKTIGQWINEFNSLGWSSIRYEQESSDLCPTCSNITFYGTCCNSCENVNNAQTNIVYSDCYGSTFLTLWNCCS